MCQHQIIDSLTRAFSESLSIAQTKEHIYHALKGWVRGQANGGDQAAIQLLKDLEEWERDNY